MKREILRAAENLEPSILATNTSGISINDLADGLVRPDRLVGLHFFNPGPAMRLVEVVTGARTFPQSVRDAVEVVTKIGKEPIVVCDAPGFASTRLGMILGLEAMRMLEDGIADVEDIDKAMELDYGHPIGRLRVTDVIGLDVRLDSARNLSRAYGERYEPPSVLIQLVKEGKLGRKSGEGFQRWE